MFSHEEHATWEEKIDEYCGPYCAHCGASEEYGLTNLWTYDGFYKKLCEDCAAHNNKLEDAASVIFNLPGCDQRRAVLDENECSSHELVVKLTAHDLACGCTLRKPVESAPAVAADSNTGVA
jgi:hypothetical protein